MNKLKEADIMEQISQGKDQNEEKYWVEVRKSKK
jgi:hypothetical protein